MYNYGNLLSGYQDRVARITLFEPLFQLERKQVKDDRDRPIDMFGVGLLSLLYFFERKLLREEKTGIAELADFILSMLKESAVLSEESGRAIAKTVIETYRPPQGKRLGRTYYDYEMKSEAVVEFSILKADRWDPEERIQYYTLAEQGLELLFATKEYFSEFQVSISQMMTRKQLEKGEFDSALRQVEEMRLSVANIKDKMAHIKKEVQKQITHDETYKRYQELITDINRRLEQEHDEFYELNGYIRTRKQGLLDKPIRNQLESRQLEKIVKVENELGIVHFLHSSLLSESIALKTTAIEAANEAIYYTGIESFNFEKEVAGKLTGKPLPLESGAILGAPFTNTEKFSTWSLLTVFEPHEMDEWKGRNVSSDFIEAGSNAVDEALAARQRLYDNLLGSMFEKMNGKKKFSLKQVLDRDADKLLNNRPFYDFWMILHQKSPLNIKEIIEHEEHVFSTAFKKHLKDFYEIEVRELDDHLAYDDGFGVLNMELVLKGGADND